MLGDGRFATPSFVTVFETTSTKRLPQSPSHKAFAKTFTKRPPPPARSPAHEAALPACPHECHDNERHDDERRDGRHDGRRDERDDVYVYICIEN